MREKEFDVLDESEIDILELLRDLWNHKVLIVLLAVIFGLLMFVKTEYFTADTYTSTGILYVSNKKDLMDQEQSIQKSDIDTSRSLSTTYIEILKTRAFLTDVSRSVRGDYSWNQIYGMLSIVSINETELLRISVKANSALDAYQIASSIMEKAPDKLTSVYKSGEVEVVDPPVKPQAADDNGLVRNVCLGILVGLVLGCIYVFVRSRFDTKIHKSEDIEKRYNVSILGEIAQ